MYPHVNATNKKLMLFILVFFTVYKFFLEVSRVKYQDTEEVKFFITVTVTVISANYN